MPSVHADAANRVLSPLPELLPALETGVQAMVAAALAWNAA